MRTFTGIVIAGAFIVIELFATLYASPGVTPIPDIATYNPPLKSLREDIRKTMYITKSGRDGSALPALRFYTYTAKKGESFWMILSRTSQNIDTLMNVNSLESVHDVVPGKALYIPNMRGIIIDNKKMEPVEAIAARYRINPQYLKKINDAHGGTKRYLFVPNAMLTRLERSLFLGTGFSKPVRTGRRSSGFGNRIDPIMKKIRFHGGVDIACREGTKIHAARGGRVIFAGMKGGYGKTVIIEHPYQYQSIYGHLSSIKSRVGSVVKQGDLIALSGNTGRTTGPHLHFEVRKKSKPINPDLFLRR